MEEVTRRSYDKVARAYARTFRDELAAKPLDRALLEDIARRLGPGAAVLDAGCGPGHVTAHLAGLGLDAMGVDLSPSMIDVASSLNPLLRFEVASMLALPVGDAVLDGIVAMYSVIHLDDADLPRVFAEFRRALRANGLLLVSFHVGDEVVHLTEFLGEQVDLDFHLRSMKAMSDWLGSAGFAVELALERSPYPDVEAPTRRGYVVARSLR